MKNEDWCLWPSELNGVPAVSRSRVNNNKIFVTKTAISSAKTTKLVPLPPHSFCSFVSLRFCLLSQSHCAGVRNTCILSTVECVSIENGVFIKVLVFSG